MELPQETEPPHNPAMPLKYTAEGLRDLHVYCCTIQKGQETQTVQMLINDWMNKNFTPLKEKGSQDVYSKQAGDHYWAQIIILSQTQNHIFSHVELKFKRYKCTHVCVRVCAYLHVCRS